MKSFVVLLVLTLSFSASASDTKAKCSWSNGAATKEVEKVIESLIKANTDLGFRQFISQSVSVSITESGESSFLVCVTSSN